MAHYGLKPLSILDQLSKRAGSFARLSAQQCFFSELALLLGSSNQEGKTFFSKVDGFLQQVLFPCKILTWLICKDNVEKYSSFFFLPPHEPWYDPTLREKKTFYSGKNHGFKIKNLFIYYQPLTTKCCLIITCALLLNDSRWRME